MGAKVSSVLYVVCFKKVATSSVVSVYVDHSLLKVTFHDQSSFVPDSQQ